MAHGSLVVCVVGASGFIGQHLVSALAARDISFRYLIRQGSVDRFESSGSFVGDLFDINSLLSFLVGADILINLAQPAEASDEKFSEGIENLANAAKVVGVRRVLHISTAMVVGIPETSHITELSECHPMTGYERQKLSAERIFHHVLSGQVDFAILRPSAVFGVGGRNLLKLAGHINGSSSLYRNFLRFIHGHRRMHLVSVMDVVDAIVFLAFVRQSLDGNIFLIASDHEPSNNYQAVDAILGAAMGKAAPLLSLSMPQALLGFLLRLAGRSQTDPRLIYDSSKIRSWGFKSKNDFTSALEEFAKAYMKSEIQ